MRLSELIEEALSEIAIGVKNAKEKSRSVFAITPGRIDGKSVAEITYIDFDVSVAVTESSEGTSSREKGFGGELKVMSIGVNGKSANKLDTKSGSTAQLTHRISFKVPVCMAAEFDIKEPRLS